MEAGQFYESIPYDYAGTDTAILAQLDAWKQSESPKILSITGPLTTGNTMQITVLYEVEA